MAWRGMARHGRAGLGMARHGKEHGLAWRGKAWFGLARCGWAGQGLEIGQVINLALFFLLKSRTFQHSRGVEKYYPPAIFPIFPEYRLDFSRFQRKIKALRVRNATAESFKGYQPARR